MHSCKNAEKKGCHSLIVKHKKRFKSTENNDPEDPISLWHSDEESQKLDDICKKCESRFFHIKKKECPICESKDFKETKGFEFYDGDVKIREDSFLICKNCMTFLRFINLL